MPNARSIAALASSLLVAACAPGTLAEVAPEEEARDAHAADPDASTPDARPIDPREDAGTAPPDRASDAGTATDAARSSDGGARLDAGAGDRARVGVFVAQGYVGRTTISCDDGRSWIANESMDDALRCGSVDCDHHPGRAMGVVHDEGGFVAAWGWGASGSVERSADGRAWETTMSGPTFGGVAAGIGRVLLGSRAPRVSSDAGATWTSAGTPSLEAWNVRRAGFVGSEGGRFLLVAEDARESDLAISDGTGAWWGASSFPNECGQAIQNDGGIAAIGDTMVIVGGDGVACRSTDGGTTWRSTSIGTTITSRVVQTPTALWVWGGGRLFSSTDGERWTATPTVPASVVIGAVARGPSGTLVAVNGGWDQWYERQRFYRSEDGVRWTELEAGRYARSHPIHAITYGEVDAEACAGALAP